MRRAPTVLGRFRRFLGITSLHKKKREREREKEREKERERERDKKGKDIERKNKTESVYGDSYYDQTTIIIYKN